MDPIDGAVRWCHIGNPHRGCSIGHPNLPNLRNVKNLKFHKCFKNTIYDILNDFWLSYATYEAKTSKNTNLWIFQIFI